jgi:hypothetical protein
MEGMESAESRRRTASRSSLVIALQTVAGGLSATHDQGLASSWWLAGLARRAPGALKMGPKRHKAGRRPVTGRRCECAQRSALRNGTPSWQDRPSSWARKGTCEGP